MVMIGFTFETFFKHSMEVLGWKPLGCSKMDSVFYPFESVKWVPGTFSREFSQELILNQNNDTENFNFKRLIDFVSK